MAKPVALVTGAGRKVGIAAGIARTLARNGWDLALTYWTPYDERMPWGVQHGDVEELNQELLSLGARVSSTSWNLEPPESATGLFDILRNEAGPISALILCHCESVDSGILDTDTLSLDRHFAVNVRSSVQLIQCFALQVPPQGGSIVALTSDHTVGNVPYGATKAALDRIVLAAARELSNLRVRANVINPGPIDTGWMDESVRNQLIQRQPSGRLGTPNDIGNCVAFLLSSEGAWINGQLLKVDGGFSA